jgi:hypothetical protein
MKKIKFNATTSVHMIPDDIYPQHCKEMKDLRYKNFKDLGPRIAAGSEFELHDVKIGDVIEVPEWYYESKKDIYISVSVSFEKYKDKSGNPIPYNMEEAIRHGDVDDPRQTMKKVKLFDLVIETEEENKEIKRGRPKA